jgi:hypothetical protein
VRPEFSAIADSLTFIEDQLESVGVFPHAHPVSDHPDVAAACNLATRLLRLQRVDGSAAVLASVDFHRVAETYCKALGAELGAPLAKPSEFETSQLSLFDDGLSSSTLVSAA